MDTLKKNLEQQEKAELIAIIQHMLRQEPDLQWLLMPLLPAASPRKSSLDPEIYRQQILAAMSAFTRCWSPRSLNTSMTIGMSTLRFVSTLSAALMDLIAALLAKKTIRKYGCGSYVRSSPSTTSIRKAGWTWMRISLVCWWATPHQRNDELLRVGHRTRSLTKQHGAAASHMRPCWQL